MTSGSIDGGNPEPEAVGIIPGAQPVAAEPVKVATAVAQPMPQAIATGNWVVQVGAAPSESGARSLLDDAASTIAALGDFQQHVERLEKNGQIFYRARFAGFGGRDDATTMCNELKKAKIELPRDAKLRGSRPREARLWPVYGVAQMSDTSSLSELARFIGQSAVAAEDPLVRRRAISAMASRLSPRPVRKGVADLLGVVLALSARTRRMVMPGVEIDLDVFGPDGGRAVRIRMPRPTT